MASVLDFKLSPWNKYCFLVSGFLHDVRSEFTDDVSKLTVGPNKVILINLTSEYGTHSEFRNVVGKFVSDIV
jgi:hypothetical protein